MKDVLCHEWLFFCSRDELETLQLVRRSLLNKIVARSNVLPLRSIQRVDGVDRYDPLDKIQIFVEDADFSREVVPDYETACRYGDIAGVIRRLWHSCIKTFCFGIYEGLFLWYWQQDATDVTVMSITFDPPETPGYDALDSIVNLLRPKTVDVSEECGPRWWDERAGYKSKYMECLTRDSFRNSLQICTLNVWSGVFPPPTFVLGEPGYSTYELRIHDSVVAKGIDAFIKSFVDDGCANRKLESVLITWTVQPHGRRPFGPSPMPERLNNPTKSDKLLPEAEAARLRSYPGFQGVSQGEMHVFENENPQKRMEVYQWSVAFQSGSSTHVLQCLVKDVE